MQPPTFSSTKTALTSAHRGSFLRTVTGAGNDKLGPLQRMQGGVYSANSVGVGSLLRPHFIGLEPGPYGG